MQLHSFPTLLLSAALALASVACSERPATTGAAGELPDWSGIWAQTDKSFWAANIDAYAGNLKLTPEYARLRQQARDQRRQANMSTCLPAGPSAVHQHGMFFEVLLMPSRVTLLYEDGSTRRIYTDGRAHRPLAELSGSYMGDSIGHWEGATLVVDTVGFPNGELWQNYGVRATLDTHMSERIFVNAAGELQFDTVVTDPAIFAEPYIYTRNNLRQAAQYLEGACQQNNRDTGTEIDLTPPEE